MSASSPSFRPSRALLSALTALLLGVTLFGLLGCSSEPPPAEPSGPTVEVLATGSVFRGANGIHFGPDGRLYVASVVTPGIGVLDPESGELLELWGPDDEAKAPDDIAFGPDGAAYWTNISIGDIGKRTPDGVSSIIANLGPGVNPITFSDDGRLFVSQCFMGTHLFEIDPNGEREPRIIRDDLGPNCGLNGMDWGPDQRLYGPRWFRGEVVKIDVDSGALETVADGFGVPAAVKFDSQGRLHVLDALRGEVVRIGDDGSKEVVGRLQPGLDNIAFGPDDRLFVSSFADGFVAEVLGPGDNRMVSRGGINMPGGIAVIPATQHDVADAVVIADFFALRTLDGASGEERDVVRDVIGFSDLGSVMSVHVAPADGDLLVLSSWFDSSVRLWKRSSAELVALFGELAAPVDALYFGDDLVVSEYAAQRVVRFSPQSPDERVAMIEGVAGPAGLAARNGDLYLTTHGDGRLLQIAADGAALAEPRVVADGLAGPEGIAVGAEGMLYVVEAGAGRVLRIDPVSGARETLAEGLETHVESQGAFPGTMLFNGIGVGSDSLYVSGDRANVVYRIRL